MLVPGGEDVFRSLGEDRWARCGENPVRLLHEASEEALPRAAGDSALIARLTALEAAFAHDLERPSAGPFAPDRPIAFVCAEYGVHQSLPMYSGGLGALAGDLLKEASDQALPLVAIGLLYRQGCFRQRLDASGWHQEYWVDVDPDLLPAAPCAVRMVSRSPSRSRSRARRSEHRSGALPSAALRCFCLMPIARRTGASSAGSRPSSTWATRSRVLRNTPCSESAASAHWPRWAWSPAVLHLNEGHGAFAALDKSSRLMPCRSHFTRRKWREDSGPSRRSQLVIRVDEADAQRPALAVGADDDIPDLHRMGEQVELTRRGANCPGWLTRGHVAGQSVSIALRSGPSVRRSVVDLKLIRITPPDALALDLLARLVHRHERSFSWIVFGDDKARHSSSPGIA